MNNINKLKKSEKAEKKKKSEKVMCYGRGKTVEQEKEQLSGACGGGAGEDKANRWNSRSSYARETFMYDAVTMGTLLYICQNS